MDSAPVKRPRLVVVADDFGKSSSVNRAVLEAHGKGLVTAASIMAGGEAFEEAVLIAGNLATLSVGLHVTLCDGRAVLPAASVPGLAGSSGAFLKNPARAWIRYYRAGLLQQLDNEIAAQFDRLAQTGIQPTHVDGHHHIHMHPVVFSLIVRHAARWNVRWVRVPAEPLRMALRSSGRGFLPLLEWSVFRPLAFLRRKKAERCGLRVADRVYGLSRTGSLDEHFLLGLLDRPAGVTEIFSHPDAATEAGRRELKALTSSAVLKRAAAQGIELTGYRELGEDGKKEPGGW